jgi:thioredoxin 1
MADKIFTDANFHGEVLEEKKPVLVDFWAPWCGPCKVLTPIVEELAKEYAGKVVVGKLNVDENQKIAGQYGVMSIPTVMLFKDGKPVHSMVGVQSKQTYKGEIEKVLVA